MYILLDIGGTNTRVASSIDKQTIKNVKIFKTNPNYKEALKHIELNISAILEGHKIEAIMVGVAAIFDRTKTKIINATNLPGWINVEIKKDLSEMFQTNEVYLENDTALAALYEASKEEHFQDQIIGYLRVGTGVGGARIVNGQIDKNSYGFEPGQQIIDYPNDISLEDLVGGKSIEKRYGFKAEEIDEKDFWNNLAKVLSIGVYNSILYWSCDLIILGGAVVQKIPMDRIEHQLMNVMKVFPIYSELKKATHDDLSGIKGGIVYLNQL